ncbi:chemotaxis regulator, protein phosphatase for CheY (plasmid) [Cupriavidus taiwanensis]|uniref:Protein phosphatase CheZ n=2 Tax=Cupriavidus TaxID=106589 RepID=A0A375HVX9_9BURK|nr:MULTISPECIES: protein phosphatase CheZ [Cupriavidus]EON18313.1 chemotaxis regulator CheZ [Cupriavidus sp. GA3-3]SOY70253.1 Chemotaxis protein cheZ; Chemotaxis phosphatase [Cupriavidus taiwanensis]SOY70609.1 Chemotaxis protein cheZ; Chemotaxis phosphatase [Cupriavidus taiwanensis]SOY95511.1 Chemotaxis protein cheZ; Chemotaxis phosphatase [Cupriavidus taiwanensis]SOZ39669.1 Chemotaxis protein cheZ; Chemotaxis phosphatase [Cupriavidus neocaledonicus]
MTPTLSNDSAEQLILRIGNLTRMLRDNMRELGLDKEIERAAQAIPDARDRLNYIAAMTEQAAERTLNAVELAQPIQSDIEQQAETLDKRWAAWFEKPVELADARSLVLDTRAFLSEVPGQARATNSHLLDIMMAQDFQDLTGQVIKKMMDMIRTLEQELLQVLIDNVPSERRVEVQAPSTLMNGPQVNPEGKPDVVSDQAQVDDLLASLGF